MKWSPVQRGIAAALLAWGVCGLFVYAEDYRIEQEYWRHRYDSYYSLVQAIEKNDLPAVKRMLDEGTDPNWFPPASPDDKDSTAIPLYEAVASQDTAMAKLLLEHGADPNGRDNWCDSLTTAATNDNLEMMSLLFQYGGGKSKDSALWQAAVRGKVRAVRFLLAQGANPDQVSPEPVNYERIRMEDSLRKAVIAAGHLEILPLLEKASTKRRH